MKRAQGRPGACCTRGLMCRKTHALVHMSIQVQRKHSGLPCATALRLIRALPGDLAFLSPSPAGLTTGLTPTLGRQDHALSSCARRHASRDITRPSQPAPRFVTVDTPLLSARDACIEPVICAENQALFPKIGITVKSMSCRL